MATIKELNADCCPKCNKEGKETLVTPISTRDGKQRLINYTCETESCRWYQTGWVVQVDSRGNVYERPKGERGMDKDFPKISPDALSRGKMHVEDAIGERIEDDAKLPSTKNLEAFKPKE